VNMANGIAKRLATAINPQNFVINPMSAEYPLLTRKLWS